MNNFDDIEKLWRQQTVRAPADPRKARAAQAIVERDANRHGRVLKWGIFATGFGLAMSQVLTIINQLQGVRPLTWAGGIQHVVMLVFQIALLVVLVRRLRAHQKLLKVGAANVRENARTALAIVEHEMRSYRIDARIAIPFLLLVTVPLIEGYRLGYFDAMGLAGRMLFILGLTGAFVVVGLRHYRQVLQPQRERLAELLKDLDES
jgi:hypothetical protein